MSDFGYRKSASVPKNSAGRDTKTKTKMKRMNKIDILRHQNNFIPACDSFLLLFFMNAMLRTAAAVVVAVVEAVAPESNVHVHHGRPRFINNSSSSLRVQTVAAYRNLVVVYGEEST